MSDVDNPVAEYPKWIDHPTEEVGKSKDGKRIPVRILVKDAKEEAKAMGKVSEKHFDEDKKSEIETKPKVWPTK